METKYNQFVVAKYLTVYWLTGRANNTIFCHKCSVYSCGTVQDVHCHGSVTSETNSKCSLLYSLSCSSGNSLISGILLYKYNLDLKCLCSLILYGLYLSQPFTFTAEDDKYITNSSPPPNCHFFSPTLGLIITLFFFSSTSAPSPSDPRGPGWADLLHPFAGGSPSEEIKRYVCGRCVGTL